MEENDEEVELDDDVVMAVPEEVQEVEHELMKDEGVLGCLCCL